MLNADGGMDVEQREVKMEEGRGRGKKGISASMALHRHSEPHPWIRLKQAESISAWLGPMGMWPK